MVYDTESNNGGHYDTIAKDATISPNELVEYAEEKDMFSEKVFLQVELKRKMKSLDLTFHYQIVH